LPVAAAVKTGTSKGYRDNWTVGYTRSLTVAVWVGNFDGRPLRGSSGVTGAAPLFRDVMLAAMRDRRDAPLADVAGLLEAEVCSLSGELAGADCPHRVRERFAPERMPQHACAMHVRVRVDPRNGLLAGAGCTDAVERVLERYPPLYRAWAERVGRPVTPDEPSPRCPPPSSGASSQPAVLFPADGARFVLDPALATSAQRLVLRARAAAGRVAFLLDGHKIAEAGPPWAVEWPLAAGKHALRVKSADGSSSETVSFEVVGL
jgi:penicillin-binding protein 1C